MPTLNLQTLMSLMFGILPRPRQAKRQAGKQMVASTKRRPSAGTPQKPIHAASNVRTGIRFRSFEAFHGTPSLVNARSIIQDGWMIGRGNANGDGVYMGLDRATALPYAKPTGVLVRCRVSGVSCEWGPQIGLSLV